MFFFFFLKKKKVFHIQCRAFILLTLILKFCFRNLIYISNLIYIEWNIEKWNLFEIGIFINIYDLLDIISVIISSIKILRVGEINLFNSDKHKLIV